MARSTTRWTESEIARRVRLGYGQGTGRGYKSWLTRRDFSSRGITSGLPSWKLGRSLALFSHIERNAFLVAQFHEGFGDYWENWPISRSVSLDIANELGVRHPRYPDTLVPVVMTLDGVLTTGTPEGPRYCVVDCKPDAESDKAAVAAKLAIHREFTRRMGWTYRRYSQESFPDAVVTNLVWLEGAWLDENECRVSTEDYEVLAARFYRDLTKDLAGHSSNMVVRDYCYLWDRKCGLTEGCGLRCLRILMLQRLVSFDLELSHLRLLRGALSHLNVAPPMLSRLSGAEDRSKSNP